ncbi:hypothetical protein GOP47_0022372 [Adiantum capillus-veneris]|uniref:MLO-like protein n=1 Tax=Adiantum capillus-veneris TaxID=13818 RepID=A0A9D4U6D6_ADICA|nr:hypothetical protein GOP47_0022372 [Adiantum capillus-veneris]
MAAAGDDDSTNLLRTPTWAIACTCAIFILISIIIERVIHRIGHYAGKYNHAALRRAFEKIKDELLMVGILSLLLAIGQSAFAKVCVPKKVFKYARLCEHSYGDTKKTPYSVHDAIHVEQRKLAAATTAPTCKTGNVPFMTTGSMHDLHIFIFILAVVHIVYTLIIIAIGMWAVGRWKGWEEKATEREKKVTAEGAARLTHQTTFIRNRAANKWLRCPPAAYGAAFFTQFFRRVTETDYITLRSGFIKRHFGDNRAFNFHKYVQRSFQEDFKHVVGISTALWIYAIVWLLANVNGWETNVFVTLIPLLLVLIVGTKMQYILTQMANEILEQHCIVQGIPHVEPNDKHFWFGKPKFMLYCFHFIVFQNALGSAYAIWAWFTFTDYNCLYGKPISLLRRIVIGIVVQLVCGLVALPVYALVSQMGSHLKKTIFDEVVSSAVMNWQARAKRNAGSPKNNSNRSVHLLASPLNVEEDHGVPPPPHHHHEVEMYAHAEHEPAREASL